MRPPLAGKRAALRRIGEDLRRRLEPVERALAATLPVGGSGRGATTAAPDAPTAAGSAPTSTDAGRAAPTAAPAPAGADAAPPDPPVAALPPADAAARIDAARKRLRAQVPPRDPDDG